MGCKRIARELGMSRYTMRVTLPRAVSRHVDNRSAKARSMLRELAY